LLWYKFFINFTFLALEPQIEGDGMPRSLSNGSYEKLSFSRKTERGRLFRFFGTGILQEKKSSPTTSF
jgi:hypothetical protein